MFNSNWYRAYMKFSLTGYSVKSVNSATLYMTLGGSSMATITPSVNTLNGSTYTAWTEASAVADFNSGAYPGLGGWAATTFTVPAFTSSGTVYTATITGDSSQGVVKSYNDKDSYITVHLDVATTAAVSTNTAALVLGGAPGSISFYVRTNATYYPYILLDYVSGHNPVHSGTSGAMLF